MNTNPKIVCLMEAGTIQPVDHYNGLQELTSYVIGTLELHNWSFLALSLQLQFRSTDLRHSSSSITRNHIPQKKSPVEIIPYSNELTNFQSHLPITYPVRLSVSQKNSFLLHQAERRIILLTILLPLANRLRCEKIRIALFLSLKKQSIQPPPASLSPSLLKQTYQKMETMNQ